VSGFDANKIAKIAGKDSKYLTTEFIEISGKLVNKNVNHLSILHSPGLDFRNIDMLTKLTSLTLSNCHIKNVTPLKNLINLEKLDLSGNFISDISPLNNLTKLTYLNLSSAWGYELVNLNKLTNLKELMIKVVDLYHIENLTNLEYLFAQYMSIIDNDIRSLGKLTKLKILNLSNRSFIFNDNIDLTPLGNLTNLKTLTMNLIVTNENIVVLEKLVNLKRLYLEENRIGNISSLRNLVKMKELSLENNTVRDVTPLGNLVNLDYLNLGRNEIHDITPLRNLVNLEYLNLGSNDIDDITPLRNLVNLEYLNIWNNNLRDVTPLGNLVNLSYLNLERNNIFTLPNNIVNLVVLNNFIFDQERIGNLQHEPIRNWVRRWVRILQPPRIVYPDVHQSDIQDSSIEVVRKLMERWYDIQDYPPYDSRLDRDHIRHGTTYHGLGDIKKIYQAVIIEIRSLDEDLQPEAYARLKDELDDAMNTYGPGQPACFVGIVTRIINSINGISPRATTKIPDIRDINAICALHMNKKPSRTPKPELEYILQGRGHTKENIEQALENYPSDDEEE